METQIHSWLWYTQGNIHASIPWRLGLRIGAIQPQVLSRGLIYEKKTRRDVKREVEEASGPRERERERNLTAWELSSSWEILFIRLAKNLIWIFPQFLLEKPKLTLWLTQYFLVVGSMRLSFSLATSSLLPKIYWRDFCFNNCIIPMK